MIELTPRQRRILLRLAAGDFLWEVAGEKYFTQFNEKTSRQLRVHLPALQPLVSANLIHLQRRPEAEHRLDYWDISEQGREVLTEGLQTRNRAPKGLHGRGGREIGDPAA